ncbi:LysE family transporter [Winogradskyella immobilis]|uniref:LysE family transporter n=1 Tax=Winogradskyella immobilis TaxID=2816852 RepID=A0ABS8EL37_9FLAO|nr:LysE family transporter [Winogradskyella immobilis]MCC1483795.1 LysE family transporter [Winogradskyella immobilis]MCG0015889.1 LysE family translocator [Winogradskyella immobilis]
MILLYIIIGLLASVIGALPLGGSNIAVINTTLKQNAKQAFKIAIAAGIAEVMLSYYALHCNMVVKDFFDNNQWLQILIAVLLLVIGGFLFLKSNKTDNNDNKKQSKLAKSKYATGFLLGLLNPPVLIYWLIVYGIINNNDFMLTLKSPISVLFLFFGGVYLGKILTLYLYSKFSIVIKNKFKNINGVINKVTGVLLFIIGIAQFAKLYFI